MRRTARLDYQRKYKSLRTKGNNDTYLNLARSVPASEFNDNLINENSFGAMQLIFHSVARGIGRAKSLPVALRIATSSPSVVDRGRWFYPL